MCITKKYTEPRQNRLTQRETLGLWDGSERMAVVVVGTTKSRNLLNE